MDGSGKVKCCLFVVLAGIEFYYCCMLAYIILII